MSFSPGGINRDTLATINTLATEIKAATGDNGDKANIDNLVGRTEANYQHIHSRAKVYPSQGAGIIATASATAWAMGNFVEIIPALSNDFQAHNLEITVDAGDDGDVYVELNGTIFTVAVTGLTGVNGLATQIRAATFTGWTTGGVNENITFTSDTLGFRGIAYFSAAAGVGAVGTMTTTQAGAGIVKEFDIHWLNAELMTNDGTYEIALYTDTAEVCRCRVTRSANITKSDHLFLESPVIAPGTQIRAKISCSSAGAGRAATISLGYHTYDI